MKTHIVLTPLEKFAALGGMDEAALMKAHSEHAALVAVAEAAAEDAEEYEVSRELESALANLAAVRNSNGGNS